MSTFLKKFESPVVAFAEIATIVPEARGASSIYDIAAKIFADPVSPYKFIVRGGEYILLEIVGPPRCVFEILASGSARIEPKNPETEEAARAKEWLEPSLLRHEQF